ncbi:DUF2177 family protein [Neorhizobium sp. JUb45]|uniref:DUF2177 family protein n=1 Tax=unclassified Neorhizobium TaxID=2629175 RepID=UPI0010514F4B|nr:DUF2177 family protein [Neorhizobium sp. JUb45]TCR03184.1 putative membrane protein [Neorhizobium sp. JUb45]
MKTYATAYAVTLIVFVVVDFIWLSVMADRLYRPVMGDMLAPKFRLAPAIVFYIIFIAGMTFLAVRPGILAQSVWVGLIHGAVLGFTAYATYDLTSQAVLKNWSTALTVADLIWGTFVSAIAAGAGTWAALFVKARSGG